MLVFLVLILLKSTFGFQSRTRWQQLIVERHSKLTPHSQNLHSRNAVRIFANKKGMLHANREERRKETECAFRSYETFLLPLIDSSLTDMSGGFEGGKTARQLLGVKGGERSDNIWLIL